MHSFCGWKRHCGPEETGVFAGHQAANQLVLNRMIRESGLAHGYLPSVFANGAIFEKMDVRRRAELVSYHATGSFPGAGRTSLEIKHRLLAEAVYAVKFLREAAGTTSSEADLEELGRLVPPGPGRRMLIVGAGDGRVVLEALTHLFSEMDAEAHALGQYDSPDPRSLHHPQARDRFLQMVEECGLADRVHFYDGEVAEALAWMAAEEGFWESFAMAWLEPRDSPAELLMAACGAWNLLQPGGCMVWMRDPVSLTALDSFFSSFGDRAEIVLNGKLVSIRKHPRPALYLPVVPSRQAAGGKSRVRGLDLPLDIENLLLTFHSTVPKSFSGRPMRLFRP